MHSDDIAEQLTYEDQRMADGFGTDAERDEWRERKAQERIDASIAARPAVSVLREAQRKAYADLADHFVDHGDKARVAAAIATNDFFLLGANPAAVYDAQAAWLGERFTPSFA